VAVLAILLVAMPIPARPDDPVRFAVFGDYGNDSAEEAAVAALVKSWGPDLILTTGDNNYPNGEMSTIDRHVGKHYGEFIAPYNGTYGPGAKENRFFPCLGNHDWGHQDSTRSEGPRAYLDWFELPGNERYYDFSRGPVHFFAIDSDPREPDGVSADSKQASWLKARLEAAEERWKIVYFHHPPYSSGVEHGPSRWMRWPFGEWGVTAVFCGHEHNYERIHAGGGAVPDSVTYFVVGTGGARTYGFARAAERAAGSRKRIRNHGAMRVTATSDRIVFEFFETGGPPGEPSDRFELASDRREP
jgi:hypothetical protein